MNCAYCHQTIVGDATIIEHKRERRRVTLCDICAMRRTRPPAPLRMAEGIEHSGFAVGVARAATYVPKGGFHGLSR